MSENMSKIIIIDDDDINAGLIKMLLEFEGYAVEACTTVSQAKTAASHNQISAFIIDYHLERDTNGVDITRAIRANHFGRNRDAVIIMTSGDPRCEQEATAVGADSFLHKPFQPATLTQQLQQLLAAKEQHG